jgi:hypothetical protein
MMTEKKMKTAESKIADLENAVKRQGRALDSLLKKISLLERENLRRRTELEKLKNERR